MKIGINAIIMIALAKNTGFARRIASRRIIPPFVAAPMIPRRSPGRQCPCATSSCPRVTLRAAAIFQIIESASALHLVRAPSQRQRFRSSNGRAFRHPVRMLLRVQAAVFARGHAERRRKLPVKGGRVCVAHLCGHLLDGQLGLRQQLCRLPPQTAAGG